MLCLPLLPLTCIRGQGFVGCLWGILRFFDIQAISHQEALEVLSFQKQDFSLVLALCSPCQSCSSCFPCPLVSSLHLPIRRLFYDLSLYPISLYSIVVAQPSAPNPKAARGLQGITLDVYIVLHKTEHRGPDLCVESSRDLLYHTLHD